MKLNLGAGSTVLEGYEPRDGARGDKLWPLPDADNSVDEIRASHVLEHLPHSATAHVLKDWMRVLKPGGVLKLAVPDFQQIAKRYLDGEAINVQGYVMGGQTDTRDFHHAIFDREGLEEAMRSVGLIAVRTWKSEIDDCAALPISLNLAGTKPGGKRPSIVAVMSTPRLAFSDNLACVAQLKMPVRKVTGAFWGQCLTRAIELVLAEEKPEWILTVDYDTIWTPATLETLIDIAVRHPEADAIAPLQSKRGARTPLFFIRGRDGKAVAEIPRTILDAELVATTSAHFGLTLLRASMFASLRKPWFAAAAAPDGSWGEGRIDDDIWFWQQLEKSGRTCYIAPRVVVGHGEFKITWPNVNLEPIHQDPTEFWESGPPEGVWT